MFPEKFVFVVLAFCSQHLIISVKIWGVFGTWRNVSISVLLSVKVSFCPVQYITVVDYRRPFGGRLASYVDLLGSKYAPLA